MNVLKGILVVVILNTRFAFSCRDPATSAVQSFVPSTLEHLPFSTCGL